MRLKRAPWSDPAIALAIAAVALVQIALVPRTAIAGPRQIKEGRELFLHEWTPNDPLSAGGDGLGPMFNAVSCAACHNLGGLGGAGDNRHNVELLSASPPAADPSPQQERIVRSKAAKVHPAFSNGSNLLLHVSHTNPEYESWRMKLLGYQIPEEMGKKRDAVTRRAVVHKQAHQPPVVDLPRHVGAPLQLSRRSTPALFGAGLIDSIPESTLVELAELQRLRFPGITGRLPRAAGGKVGRFGWRGQVRNLREFVLTACAMELGLQNEGHAQAMDPLNRHATLKGNDLSGEQTDALVEFVASLPAPREIVPDGQTERNLVKNGERLFETIGCSACHVRDVGGVKGIFSDLLMHDLGAGLEDPVPANPDQKLITTTISGGYGGGTSTKAIDIATRVRREWRTPPLWGVRDSAPYLHDGRAGTLEAAIVAHGGEAEQSARRFEKLAKPERSHIVLFLRTLAAPGAEPAD